VSRPVQRDRCRFHFMRNAIAHAGKRQRRIVAAWIGTAFAEADAETAHARWRRVADQARTRVPKLAIPMDDAEAGVLSYMGFPAPHRAQLCSANPLERVAVTSSASLRMRPPSSG
jgi:putative transposase